jgi:E3 ubiquitin-protein ligase ATL10/75/76/77/78
MYASTSFTSQLVHDYELLVESNTRRLLFQDPVDHRSLTNSPVLTNNHNSTDSYFGIRKFDANVVMILGVLLCALICSLALNSIIRCVLRFLNVAINNDSSLSSSSNSSPQLANKGIKKKALKTFPTVSYSTELKLPSLDTECVICLSEFTKGEKVRIFA